MKKRSKNILIGLGALVLIGSAGFLIAQEMKNRKKDVVSAKHRAENAYIDSITQKDIAWG
tara:strand:- start:340 stop:519 length:180 start_codon:yes stop_codon:yes gene_type:complete